MIKKDKLFELKIEEDDEVSGIDSISLVDEPAIEINWMYFNKVKPQEFHIPDNEDEKYLEKLKAIAQNEQELLDEGWVVSKITPMGKEGFITAPDPNASSEENEKEYRVRYKYVLNPQAGTNPVIPTTRDFCRELVQKNYVWRLEDLDALINDEGDSALVWRGGYNCRHLWARIEYNYDDTIRNKASVNRGRINPQAPLDTRVLGLEQPDTRVPANPSFSKEKMEVGVPHYTEDGKLYEGPTHKDAEGRLMTGAVHTEDSEYLYHEGEFESVSDYPDSISKAAERGIKLNEENGNKCATQVGKVRAQQLANSEPISMETIKRMYSYLSRAETYYDDADETSDCGYISFLLWGGKSALSWAESKLNDFGYDVSTIGGYEDTGIKKKKKQKKFAADEEKRTIVGPAMVPDLRIARKTKDGDMYEVYFSADTIKMIAEKYMKNQYTRNNDLMHDGTAVKDVYVIESWIKEDMEDKSNKYGYGDLPVGTWFVAMKVAKTPEGDKVWEMVKSGELAGYSVSGWFEEVAAFCREEMFLHKVVEILKKYD
jgi:hypothetical protein